MSIYNDRRLDANGQPEKYHRVDYAKWFFHLFTWDGVVPLVMWSLPFLMRRFGPPNNDQALVFAVVGGLIVGILLRYTVGMRHIRSNYCSVRVKSLQQAGLFAMIALLVLIETLLCFLPPIPPGGLKEPDVIFFSVVFTVYLIAMAIILYPGRRRSSDAERV